MILLFLNTFHLLCHFKETKNAFFSVHLNLNMQTRFMPCWKNICTTGLVCG